LHYYSAPAGKGFHPQKGRPGHMIIILKETGTSAMMMRMRYREYAKVPQIEDPFKCPRYKKAQER
jgi:hypothetical protein